ncbi:cation efflux protein [Pseudovirgaria hyperparasitica]|uniref:Cation efflux protein n=1 Tax=Pseudovirgaria hyperparasitica TaxID=470096 RepID=A0A6A6VW68_9PEZI|nr:cation efflux protein [Pseudovirgaria hyperparasitica]KAF2754099.1 cation efflux protein [Pseudovirgaria hyperparasitica]
MLDTLDGGGETHNAAPAVVEPTTHDEADKIFDATAITEPEQGQGHELEATELRSLDAGIVRQRGVSTNTEASEPTRASPPTANRKRAWQWHDGITAFWRRQVSVVVGADARRDHLGHIQAALERTFLAYVRTSVALSMTSVITAQMFRLQHSIKPDAEFGFYKVGKALAATFQAAALVVVLVGAYRFWRQQNALVRGKVYARGWELMVVFGMLVLSDNQHISNHGFPSTTLTAADHLLRQFIPISPLPAAMGLSKSTRMQILLAIDVAFFLLEIIVGYAVHSLALVADSFHMLNDILTLVVGLWAVKAAQKDRSSSFTYGWKRAETLGALVNGVFLVALCMSIVLDAIQRFVEPQEVQKPMLVMIVGCFGLASNVVGLFLFHDHGHSHGDAGHSHDSHGIAEEGHRHAHAHSHDAETDAVADESGRIVDVLPSTRVAGYGTASQPKDISWDIKDTPSKSNPSAYLHGRTKSGSIHPGSLRHDFLVEAEQILHPGSGQADSDAASSEADSEDAEDNEQSGLLNKAKSHAHSHSHVKKSGADHKKHHHSQPKKKGKGGHGHSHGDLNMRGVFLHVLGDALGNVGVIASALIIWLTRYKWRFYADPAISLVITLIILHTAIPLCKAASRILLQATPESVDVEKLQEDIETLEGVLSAHDIHVWQLSDTTLIASLHVQVAFNFRGQGSQRYMQLAREIRECLHGFGIHSSTIQPEFYNDGGPGSVDPIEDNISEASDGMNNSSRQVSKQNSLTESMRDSCLLDCCDNKNVCCPPENKQNSGSKDR